DLLADCRRSVCSGRPGPSATYGTLRPGSARTEHRTPDHYRRTRPAAEHPCGRRRPTAHRDPRHHTSYTQRSHPDPERGRPMTFIHVAIDQLTHTCPGDPQPHIVDRHRDIVAVIDGGPCRAPITIHCGDSVATIACRRH